MSVFKISTEREKHNPSVTSFDGWGGPLEQSRLGGGNSKTRRILRR